MLKQFLLHNKSTYDGSEFFFWNYTCKLLKRGSPDFLLLTKRTSRAVQS